MNLQNTSDNLITIYLNLSFCKINHIIILKSVLSWTLPLCNSFCLKQLMDEKKIRFHVSSRTFLYYIIIIYVTCFLLSTSSQPYYPVIIIYHCTGNGPLVTPSTGRKRETCAFHISLPPYQPIYLVPNTTHWRIA